MFPPRQRGGGPPWLAPRFLDDPCVHAPLSDPGGPPIPGHFRTGDVVFRLRNDVDSAATSFGALSRGLHALCVRFAAGVAPGPRNTRFRLVASLDRSGLSPAGSRRRFPSCQSVYMASPFTRLCLAQYVPSSSALRTRNAIVLESSSRPRIDGQAAGNVVSGPPEPQFPAASSRKMSLVRNQESPCRELLHSDCSCDSISDSA